MHDLKTGRCCWLLEEKNGSEAADYAGMQKTLMACHQGFFKILPVRGMMEESKSMHCVV